MSPSATFARRPIDISETSISRTLATRRGSRAESSPRSERDGGSRRSAAIPCNSRAAPRVCLVMLNTLGAFIGGTIGWYVGAPVGTGTAFVLSMVGTAVGVYFAKTLKARLGA